MKRLERRVIGGRGGRIQVREVIVTEGGGQLGDGPVLGELRQVGEVQVVAQVTALVHDHILQLDRVAQHPLGACEPNKES